MLHRVLPDLPPPADLDLDASDLVENVLREGHVRRLGRMADIGMDLLEGVAQTAKQDPAAAADAFCKISQAVRRTLALQAKLAQAPKGDRDAVRTQRAERNQLARQAHKVVKDGEILHGLSDAYAGSCSDEDFEKTEEAFERVLLDAQESLDDGDEFAGYLDRPVGETVARLCAVLGLDPEACALEDGAWRVRRPPTEYELSCAEFRGDANVPGFPPKGPAVTSLPIGLPAAPMPIHVPVIRSP